MLFLFLNRYLRTIIIIIIIIISDIEVGLQPIQYAVMENETFPVCAELTDGSLEVNVYVGLEILNGTSRVISM